MSQWHGRLADDDQHGVAVCDDVTDDVNDFVNDGHGVNDGYFHRQLHCHDNRICLTHNNDVDDPNGVLDTVTDVISDLVTVHFPIGIEHMVCVKVTTLLTTCHHRCIGILVTGDSSAS